MFGIGTWEVFLLILVVFSLFGPELVGVARSVGRTFFEFRSGIDDARAEFSEIEKEIDEG